MAAGEIKLRAEFESSLSRDFGVPLVLLVFEGGPGTYETVMNTVTQVIRMPHSLIAC